MKMTREEFRQSYPTGFMVVRDLPIWEDIAGCTVPATHFRVGEFVPSFDHGFATAEEAFVRARDRHIKQIKHRLDLAAEKATGFARLFHRSDYNHYRMLRDVLTHLIDRPEHFTYEVDQLPNELELPDRRLTVGQVLYGLYASYVEEPMRLEKVRIDSIRPEQSTRTDMIQLYYHGIRDNGKDVEVRAPMGVDEWSCSLSGLHLFETKESVYKKTSDLLSQLVESAHTNDCLKPSVYMIDSNDMDQWP